MSVARYLYSVFVYLHIPVVISKQMFVSKQTWMEHVTGVGHLHSPVNCVNVSLQQRFFFFTLPFVRLEIHSWTPSQAHHLLQLDKFSSFAESSSVFLSLSSTFAPIITVSNHNCWDDYLCRSLEERKCYSSHFTGGERETPRYCVTNTRSWGN